jgi:glycine/sarcosine N-methyltransferase
MYQRFASNYDRFNNWKDRLAFEMPFIERQLKNLQQEPGNRLSILDAACGTGMHAIALTKEGHQVSCADLFPEMIEIAQENANSAGVKVKFRAVGFGALSTEFNPSLFNAVLCLGNSLPHLLSREDVVDALDDFNQCLLAGGILLIQNRNFDSIMQKKARWMEPQAFTESDKEWLFQRFYDFEEDGTIRFNIVTLSRTQGADWQMSIDHTLLRPLLYEELSGLIHASGFSTMELFGDMTGITFDPDTSPNLIIMAQKP